MSTKRSGLEELTDDEVVSHLKLLTARERASVLEWLTHLAEVDRRRAFLAEGCPSLFVWCRTILRLSESAAYARIRTARALRRFPAIGPRLARGDIHLDAVARLAPHLTNDNCVSLLDEATGASRETINAIVARFQPPGAIRARVVAQRAVESSAEVVPANRSASDSCGVPTPALDLFSAPVDKSTDGPSEETGLSDGGTAAPPRTDATRPINFRLHLTISPEAHDDLLRLRDLMRHQVPDGDAAALVALALRQLRRGAEKRVLGKGVRTAGRKPTDSKRSARYIPVAVRRAVRKRDGDRCAFRSHAGRRCDERGWLELHHLVPFARGGRATTGNLELRCRAHNRYEAERDFDGYVREREVVYRAGRQWRQGAGPGLRRAIRAVPVEAPGSPN